VLHHEVGASVRRRAAVDQARDVRMIEHRQNADARASETFSRMLDPKKKRLSFLGFDLTCLIRDDFLSE
jgi:hypothetical protein